VIDQVVFGLNHKEHDLHFREQKKALAVVTPQVMK
jgi:hypothetical protein